MTAVLIGGITKGHSFDKDLLIGGAHPGNIINEVNQFILGIKMVGCHERSLKLPFIEPLARDYPGEIVRTKQLEEDRPVSVENLINFDDGFGGLFG